ncbi:hypothetical protein ACDI16_23430, partial [Oceanobacillus caeni]
MHEYTYNQMMHNIKFENNELQKFFCKEVPDQITSEESEGFNLHLTDILQETFHREFFSSRQIDRSELVISNIKDQLKKKTQTIRNDILNKYLQSENLHILMSNGCSLYAGSKAINTNQKQ